LAKLITRAVLDLKTGKWVEEESHGYDGPWAYAGQPGDFSQNGYRIFAEGTESGSTPLADANTAADVDVDTNFQVRVLMQEESQAEDTLEGVFFEYDLNASASWNPVTASSLVIQAVTSTFLDNEDPTVSRFTGNGTFISANAWVTEDGTVPDLLFPVGDYCEALLSCSIVSGDVVDGNVITVRLNATTPNPSFSFTATINVVEAGGPGPRRRSNVT
jgi:hypothetical protein